MINITTATIFIFIFSTSSNFDIPPKAIKIIVLADEAINPTDTALNPLRIFKTVSIFLYLLKKLYNIMDITNPEITHPKVAVIAPGIPAILIPTNVEVFTARGPGVICEIVIISVNS